jgi:anaerobic ribonucleoside-triphosphate reductase activating protein
MNYSNIKYIDTADGPGVRVSLFVSGCRNHCKGCFNEVTWDFNYGEPFTEIEENEILEACDKEYISGLTLLGGEPFEEENQVALLPFIEKFKKECPGKNLWMFTGYVYEKDLVDGGKKFVENVTEKILENVDMLVDGPFIQEQRDLTLQFRGSSNQRLLTREDREILRQ